MKIVKSGLKYEIVDSRGDTIAVAWHESIATQIASLPEPVSTVTPIALKSARIQGFDAGFRYSKNQLTKLKPLMLERLKLCRNFIWQVIQEIPPGDPRSAEARSLAVELLSAVSDVVMMAELKPDAEDL